MVKIQSRIPEGPLAEKWSTYKSNQNLVNPANKRKLDVIMVGTGLAGASAAASLAEMGFKVKAETLNTWWLDTGKKDDILFANAKVLDEYIKQQINGTVQESKIEGRVTIQETAKVVNSTLSQDRT